MIEILNRDCTHPYPPRRTEFTRIFWEALGEGRFLTTRGVRSGRYTFPPKPISPHEWSEQVEWVELSGKGKLYSWTTMHAVPAVFAHESPYRICVVDLDEGVRLATRLMGEGPAPLDSRIELVVVRYANANSYAARIIRAG
jgi:uncharacterized protein